MQNFIKDLSVCKEQVQNQINAKINKINIESHLHEALSYVISNQGKMLRAFLTCEFAKLFNVSQKNYQILAASIELIHLYSLIHDDLPAMDNDDYRRGKLTCHKAYDEATAILVGDALQSLAFELLTELEVESLKVYQAIIKETAVAIGFEGMVYGQGLDLFHQNNNPEFEIITRIQQYKTGKLIILSSTLPLIFADATKSEKLEVSEFAEHLGLAYQIKDDLMDCHGDSLKMGKKKGKDKHKRCDHPLKSPESLLIIILIVVIIISAFFLILKNKK